MGVLACDRNGCDNIMCDYVSSEHGYLCWECRKELIAKGPCSVSRFMDTPKVSEFNAETWERIIEEEFKSRFGEE